jgi:hypothetical protein
MARAFLGNDLETIFSRISAFNNRMNVYNSLLGNSQRANGLARWLTHDWLSIESVPQPLLCNVEVNTPRQQQNLVFCAWSVRKLHKENNTSSSVDWDSEIWSRVPRESEPRRPVLATASSIYKRQTRPLVREGAPQKQDRNCQTVINIWSWAPDGARHQDLLTDRQSQCDWL